MVVLSLFSGVGGLDLAVKSLLAGGRRALFEDTGLGKSRQQLAWADHAEGVGALTYGRRYVGCELKESYWRTGCANLSEVDRPRQSGLFRDGSPETPPMPPARG